MPKKFRVSWSAQPQAQNYRAALSYLSLVYDDKTAARYVRRLRAAKVVDFDSRDIFRASGLSLPGAGEFFAKKERRKILEGKKLAPILLVRDPQHGRLIVADGYRGLCSVYCIDEAAPIACKIV